MVKIREYSARQISESQDGSVLRFTARMLLLGSGFPVRD
jgi:hypothetical protein